mmetsp:Transcript_108345/g.302088  ORF Transcript_108345/g.302088 Transcript_108345/m.302088 type:complete len:203 (-) Transcript_108345:854-1462(-)
MVVHRGVRALLLVVHAEGVTDLVDHGPEVPHGVAPAQVDLRHPIAHAAQVAGARVVDAHLDVWSVCNAWLLDQVDARLVPPLLNSCTESFLPDVIDVCFEVIIDDHVLLPMVSLARWRKILALLPWSTAGPAIARPARPFPACSVSNSGAVLLRIRLLRQVVPVLLDFLTDTMSFHDAVRVLQVLNTDVCEKWWDTAAHVGT